MFPTPPNRDGKPIPIVHRRGRQVPETHDGLSEAVHAVFHVSRFPVGAEVEALHVRVRGVEVVEGWGKGSAHGVEAVEGVEHIWSAYGGQ